MYFHLPCLPARSPHWPLLFRAPADLVSQQRLNLNSFSSFPKPSLNRPARSFLQVYQEHSATHRLGSSPFIKESRALDLMADRNFLLRGRISLLLFKVHRTWNKVTQSGHLLWKRLLGPTKELLGSLGCFSSGLLIYLTIFSGLFWMHSWRPKGTFCGDGSAFIQCSVVLIHCKVSFDNTRRLLNYYYLQWCPVIGQCHVSKFWFLAALIYCTAKWK